MILGRLAGSNFCQNTLSATVIILRRKRRGKLFDKNLSRLIKRESFIKTKGVFFSKYNYCFFLKPFTDPLMCHQVSVMKSLLAIVGNQQCSTNSYKNSVFYALCIIKYTKHGKRPINSEWNLKPNFNTVKVSNSNRIVFMVRPLHLKKTFDF